MRHHITLNITISISYGSNHTELSRSQDFSLKATQQPLTVAEKKSFMLHTYPISISNVADHYRLSSNMDKKEQL